MRTLTDSIANAVDASKKCAGEVTAAVSPNGFAPGALAVLFGLLAAACSDTSSPGSVNMSLWVPYPELESRPFLDLAAELHTLDVWFETARISPILLADRRHLTAGWSFPGNNDDSAADEIQPVWTRAARAEISFYIHEVGPRTVAFRLDAFQAVTEEEPLLARVLLNGEPLQTLTIPPRGFKAEIDLPETVQRGGVNRLELELDRTWRISDVVPGSGDLRRVAVNCKEFVFEIQNADQRRRQDEVQWMLPEGARLEPTGPAGARTMLQSSGGLVRLWLKVPKGGVFRSGVALARSGDSAPDEARFSVTLTDRAGVSALLVDQLARLEAPIQDVEASLSEWEGRVVQLDLSVQGSGGSPEPLVGLWAAPRVTAPALRPPAPIPELELARARLKGAPVVMILLDAFNPAFAPTYGGRPGIAPNLDRIRSEGTQFDASYCQATYTIASVPSILTSRYTWEHGAWKEDTKLLDSVPTWPEAFRESGYRTVGITCSVNGSSLFGFDRGFEAFVDLYKEVSEGRTTITADQVLGPLRQVLEVEDGRPLFLWLHIVEPHEPYAPPAPWAGKYSEGFDSTLTGSADTLWDIRRHILIPTPDDLAKLKAEYEENISYVDAVVGRIVSQLEAVGIWDTAITAIFSDHGEAFLEHDSHYFAAMGHGTTVYDDQARIPFWVHLPEGLAPRGIDVPGLASNMDILPTLADLAGVTGPGGSVRGVSLASSLFDASSTARDTVVTHTHARMDSRFLPTFSIRDGSWEYIFTSGNQEELYDILADPGETTNVAASHPILAGYYRQLLSRRTGFELNTGGLSMQGDAIDIDEETMRRMQALGYAR